MPGILDGKVALVTGAGGAGIGRAAALVFAREGAKALVVSDVSEEGGEETAELVKAIGVPVSFVRCDVNDTAAVDALVAATVKQFGSLDCAFNNAGVPSPRTPLHESTDEEWARVVAINQTGVFKCLRAELRQFLAQGRGGAIVNTASTSGLIATRGEPTAYVASKHAVVGLTRIAAANYGEHGIRINALCPGPTWSKMMIEGWGGSREVADTHYGRVTALGRMAEPSEVGEAAAWLCSDRASYVTGSVLSVDGGLMMLVR